MRQRGIHERRFIEPFLVSEIGYSDLRIGTLLHTIHNVVNIYFTYKTILNFG